MSTIVDSDPTPAIAARIRNERRERGWSLDDLALKAGVSKAMLSKLERGESSPTASLLGRISGALGMTLSNLLDTGSAPASRLLRAADQPAWVDPETRYVRRQVSPLSDNPVQLIEVELPAKTEVAFPASAYGFISQLIWVLSGQLHFTEGAAVHELNPGDCLELGTPADCIFRNRKDRPCRYLVAVARRQFKS